MKRYISAILIPCLLMQLFGCYSNIYLSNEQLRYHNSYNQLTITTNDGREFFIKRNITVDEIENDSATTYCSDYYWSDDNLILIRNKVRLSGKKDYSENQLKFIKTEKLTLSKDLISEIIVSEYNYTNTIILCGIVVLAIIAGLIYVFRPNVVGSFHSE